MLVQNIERGQKVQYSGQKSGLSVSQCFGPEMYCSRYNSDFQQWGTLISLLRQNLEVTLAWRGGGQIRKKCSVDVEKSVRAQNDGKSYYINDGGIKNIS